MGKFCSENQCSHFNLVEIPLCLFFFLPFRTRFCSFWMVLLLPSLQLAGGRQEMSICQCLLSMLLVTLVLPSKEELFLWYWQNRMVEQLNGSWFMYPSFQCKLPAKTAGESGGHVSVFFISFSLLFFSFLCSSFLCSSFLFSALLSFFVTYLLIFIPCFL